MECITIWIFSTNFVASVKLSFFGITINWTADILCWSIYSALGLTINYLITIRTITLLRICVINEIVSTAKVVRWSSLLETFLRWFCLPKSTGIVTNWVVFINGIGHSVDFISCHNLLVSWSISNTTSSSWFKILECRDATTGRVEWSYLFLIVKGIWIS